MTESSKRLRFSTLVRVGQSILLVAVLATLALVVLARMTRDGQGVPRGSSDTIEALA
jgi:hypothetical protein